MEERIILAVSDFSVLYDTSRNDYRDVNKKAAAWEQVTVITMTSVSWSKIVCLFIFDAMSVLVNFPPIPQPITFIAMSDQSVRRVISVAVAAVYRVPCVAVHLGGDEFRLSLSFVASRVSSPLGFTVFDGGKRSIRSTYRVSMSKSVCVSTCPTSSPSVGIPRGYDSCVEMLLQQDTSRTMKGSSFSPLHCAVINNHARVAQLVLDCCSAHADVLNRRDWRGRTPLHAAVFSDSVECVCLLLRYGALVNCTDTRHHHSPLMMAALRGHTSSVEVLLKGTSTDLSLQDTEGNTPLHLACSKGQETCALLMLEKISDGNIINCTNSAMQTALHLAAQRGLTVVVQELLLKGATVSAVDHNGYCPALACAPSHEVANCLALILHSMSTVTRRKGPVSVSAQDLNDSDSETF